jgi:hypothetical protein
VPILSVASTRLLNNRVQDFASDFCLNLLAEIGADSGCLIVIELADPCLVAVIAPLKENQSRKVELLSLVINFVHYNSRSVDGGPFSGLGPTSLALPPSACLAMEFQFCRHVWIKEIIAASLGNFSSSDLVDLSLCKSLVNLDLLEKPCPTESEGSEPLWVILRIETNQVILSLVNGYTLKALHLKFYLY